VRRHHQRQCSVSSPLLKSTQPLSLDYADAVHSYHFIYAHHNSPIGSIVQTFHVKTKFLGGSVPAHTEFGTCVELVEFYLGQIPQHDMARKQTTPRYQPEMGIKYDPFCSVLPNKV
jgi:hypothetical protein